MELRYASFSRLSSAFSGRLAAIVAVLGCVGSASAFFAEDRWITTATSSPGSIGASGTEVTLTWGIADDGTSVFDELFAVTRSSNLINRLDAWFGAGGGGALSDRPWFDYLQSSFDRWEEISGVDFVYEPNDDGADLNTSPGVLGARADIRLAGITRDGAGGFAAFSSPPDVADVAIDTADLGFFGDPTDDAFNLRNIIMHEVGHSLGLEHITSTSARLLMEPAFQTTFDGPQLDEVRGVQFLYGDPLERNGGNDTLLTATSLGVISDGQTATVGADSTGGTEVVEGETDFVSVSNSSDLDFFSFTLTTPSSIDVTVTPLGPAYQETPEGGPPGFTNAKFVGNLNLELRRVSDASLIDSADAFVTGGAETLTDVELAPGTYAVRVGAATTETQLYQLDVSVTATGLVGDFNGDGFVDAADYSVYRDTFGSDSQLAADANGSGQIDPPDYALWAAAYGDSTVSAAIPEPGSAAVVFGIVGVASLRMSMRRSAQTGSRVARKFGPAR